MDAPLVFDLPRITLSRSQSITLSRSQTECYTDSTTYLSTTLEEALFFKNILKKPPTIIPSARKQVKVSELNAKY